MAAGSIVAEAIESGSAGFQVMGDVSEEIDLLLIHILYVDALFMLRFQSHEQDDTRFGISVCGVND